MLLLLLTFFESTVFSWVVGKFSCFQNIQARFASMDALTDDYYEVMDLKFLLAEYERTKLERQRFNMRVGEL